MLCQGYLYMLFNLKSIYVLILMPFLLSSSAVQSICLKQAKDTNLLFANCLRCHSDKIICKQRLSKKRWNSTLVWMEKKHGLKFTSISDRQKILTYLSTHYGINKKKHPMAQRPTNPLP